LNELEASLADLSILLGRQGELRIKEDICLRKSTAEIAKRIECQDALKLFHSSTDLIENLIQVGKEGAKKQEPEFVIRGLGVQLYNDCVTAHSLILSAYYQVSLMPQRDMLETALLLQMFHWNPKTIDEWRDSDADLRWKKFKPSKVRKFLKKQHGIPENQKTGIDHVYKILCEYGAHPTQQATEKLLMDKDTLYYGPTFNPEFLTLYVVDLARLSSYATICLAIAFRKGKLDKSLLPKIKKLQYHRNVWTSEYGDFKHFKPSE